jgi:hypothetical protein
LPAKAAGQAQVMLDVLASSQASQLRQNKEPTQILHPSKYPLWELACLRKQCIRLSRCCELTGSAESDTKRPHQPLQGRRLMLQITTGLKRRFQVVDAFLVQRVDLGNVDVDRLHHRSLFLGGSGH